MDQRSRNWLKGAIAFFVAILAVVVMAFVVNGGDNGEAALNMCDEGEELVDDECVAADDSDSDDQSEGDETTEASAEDEETETVDPITGLPLVSGGPLLVGDEDSQESVVGSVSSWTAAVEKMHEEEPWYATCTDKRIGVSLEDAQSYAAFEPKYDMRFILIVNSTVSDEEARRQLEADGFENVDELNVKRIDQIRNTRRTHVGGEDRCQAFLDSRPQVRVSLGIPVLNEKETKVIGLADDKGLLGHCGNPWDVPPPPKEPPTTEPPPPEGPPPTEPPTTEPPTTVPPGTTTTTTVPPTTTTTTTSPCPPGEKPVEGGCAKDDTQSPVSSDPDDPDERVRPNVTAPPVVIRPTVPEGSTTTTQAPPPSTIEDPPEVQDPEPAATTSTSTPYTEEDPIDECGDTNGDGIPDC